MAQRRCWNMRLGRAVREKTAHRRSSPSFVKRDNYRAAIACCTCNSWLPVAVTFHPGGRPFIPSVSVRLKLRNALFSRPDGTLWFTLPCSIGATCSSSIGRITTAGVITEVYLPYDGEPEASRPVRMMVWLGHDLPLDHGHDLHRDLGSHIMPRGVGLSQGSDDFCLSFRGYGPVAAQRCQDVVMANVLAKCLHLFKVELQLVGKLGDRVTDGVRPDIGQVHSRKSSSENLTDRSGVGPMLSREAEDGEAAMFVRSDCRLREKRIIGSIEP
jgi:hypothetical protein